MIRAGLGMTEMVSALHWGRAVPCPTPLSAAALVLSQGGRGVILLGALLGFCDY